MPRFKPPKSLLGLARIRRDTLRNNQMAADAERRLDLSRAHADLYSWRF